MVAVVCYTVTKSIQCRFLFSFLISSVIMRRLSRYLWCPSSGVVQEDGTENQLEIYLIKMDNFTVFNTN